MIQLFNLFIDPLEVVAVEEPIVVDSRISSFQVKINILVKSRQEPIEAFSLRKNVAIEEDEESFIVTLHDGEEVEIKKDGKYSPRSLRAYHEYLLEYKVFCKNVKNAKAV